MFKKMIRGCVCGVAAMLAGCGAQETVDDRVSAIVRNDDVSGVPGCPGTWQLPESYDGLVGQYLRSDLSSLKQGDLMTLGILTLAHEPESIRDRGNYLASVFGAAMQGGTYEAIETNPLIGAYLILSPSTATTPPMAFAVIGVRHNVARNIAAVCLGPSTEGSPFQLNRIGL